MNDTCRSRNGNSQWAWPCHVALQCVGCIGSVDQEHRFVYIWTSFQPLVAPSRQCGRHLSILGDSIRGPIEMARGGRAIPGPRASNPALTMRPKVGAG